MKSHSKIALLSLAGFASTNVMAEVWFKPRADYGLTHYQQTLVANIADTGDAIEGDAERGPSVDINLVTVGVGATFGIDALYLDIDYKTTQDSELHNYYSDRFSFPSTEIGDNGEVDRTEMSLTVGFGWEWFSLFGGYKVTSTDFEHELYIVDDTNPLFIIPNDSGGTTEVLTETSFESNGLFAGVGLGFPLGDNGSFALTGSVSHIAKATLQNDWFREENALDLEAEGAGVSVSASIWYSFLYGKVEYSRYEYNDYERAGDAGGTYDDDVTEEFSRISMGIFYQF